MSDFAGTTQAGIAGGAEGPEHCPKSFMTVMVSPGAVGTKRLNYCKEVGDKGALES